MKGIKANGFIHIRVLEDRSNLIMHTASFFKLFKVSKESGVRWSFDVSPLPDPLVPSFSRSLELSHQDDHFNPGGFSKIRTDTTL